MSKNQWLFIAVVLVILAGGGAAMGADAWDSRVQRIADAIAFAEGFYVNGSRAQKNNNPGDLTRALGFPVQGFDDIYAIFQSIDDGWNALKKQIELMLTNQSSIYNSDMTIVEVAKRYTTTDVESWARNVASRLGVSVTTKISEV